MPPPATESDNYKLLFAIVDQMEVKNINWAKVARSLGIEKVNTVQKRWSVLKRNTGLGGGNGGLVTPNASPVKRNMNGGSGSGSLATPNSSPLKSKSKSLKRGNAEIEVVDLIGDEDLQSGRMHVAKKVKVERVHVEEGREVHVVTRGFEGRGEWSERNLYGEDEDDDDDQI